MDIKTIYGLETDQIIQPAYFDCKIVNALADEWRKRVRETITDIRDLQKQIGETRDLIERYRLCMDLSHRKRQMVAALLTYRSIHRDGCTLTRSYVQAVKDQAHRQSIKNASRATSNAA